MPDAAAPTCALAPCPACGRPVVTGQDVSSGRLVAVDPAVRMYTLRWPQGEGWPQLVQSMGYPAHQCEG